MLLGEGQCVLSQLLHVLSSTGLHMQFCTVILIGGLFLVDAATHGTEEFYRTRAAVTKRLIEERGFTAVVFEADWPTMEVCGACVASSLLTLSSTCRLCVVS